jgi:CheY-like chemotaxis protein
MGKLSRSSESRTVAVIEESTDNIYSFRFILQSLGYNAVGIELNSRLAATLEKLRPSVVIVDMMVPGGNALELLRGLRHICPRPVKIIAITADAVRHEEAEIRAAGADELVVKPYSVADVQSKLE